METKRAQTPRGRRALGKRLPKLIENPRKALIARGQKTSRLMNNTLTDLFVLKKPHSLHFTRHNALHPFEDATPIEYICQKNDASLFAFGTHSKKRPNNLVLGRMCACLLFISRASSACHAHSLGCPRSCPYWAHPGSTTTCSTCLSSASLHSPRLLTSALRQQAARLPSPSHA